MEKIFRFYSSILAPEGAEALFIFLPIVILSLLMAMFLRITVRTLFAHNIKYRTAYLIVYAFYAALFITLMMSAMFKGIVTIIGFAEMAKHDPKESTWVLLAAALLSLTVGIAVAGVISGRLIKPDGQTRIGSCKGIGLIVVTILLQLLTTWLIILAEHPLLKRYHML